MPKIALLAVLTWPLVIPSNAVGMDFEAYKQALVAGDSARVMAMLRDDAGRGPTGPHGESLLHMAIWHPIGEKRAEMVAALVARGADIEARDKYGGTPLFWAAGYECVDCVRLLLKAGAQVMARNAKGATALHVAGPQVAALLIDSGADVKANDTEGNRPLHRMYHEALLAAGVNVRNKHGFTPLHFAALKGDHEGVQWLLSKGADPAAQSTERYEFQELAPEWKANPEVIEAGSRPYDIAKRWHDRTKWSIGSHRKALEILDAATPRRKWYSR